MTTNSKTEKSLLNKMSFLANKRPFFKKVEEATCLQIKDIQEQIQSISENEPSNTSAESGKTLDFKELKKRDLSIACPELSNKINL